MIFPVGIENARLRRIPVVSFAVILVCLILFGWTKFQSSEGGNTLEDVYELWVRGLVSGHGDAEVPVDCVPDDSIAQEIDEVRRQLEGTGELGAVAKEMGLSLDTGIADSSEDFQAQLDALCARAVDGQAGDPNMRLGLVPDRGLNQIGWISHIFMHGGWLHIIGNLLFFFFICGPFMEDVWGHVSMALLFVLGGLVAGAAQVGLDPHSGIPIIGASGAIAACTGAFCVRFAKRKVGFWYFFLILWRPYTGTFKVPAALCGVFWLGQDVFFQWLDGSGSGIAYMAHIGGMLFGIGMALAWRALGWEERFGYPIEDGYQFGQDDPIEREREAGKLDVPPEVLRTLERKGVPGPVSDQFDRAVAGFAAGRYKVATRHVQYLLRAGALPRHSLFVAQILARHSGKLEVQDLQPQELDALMGVCEGQRLRGPLLRLRDRSRVLGLDRPSAPPALDGGGRALPGVSVEAPAQPEAAVAPQSMAPPEHRLDIDPLTAETPLEAPVPTTSPQARPRSLPPWAEMRDVADGAPGMPVIDPDVETVADPFNLAVSPPKPSFMGAEGGLLAAPLTPPEERDLRLPDADAQPAGPVHAAMMGQGGRPPPIRIPHGWRPAPKEASLVDLEDEGFVLEDDAGRRRVLPYTRIGMMAVSVVPRPGGSTEALTDLVLRPTDDRRPPVLLRLPFERLHSDTLLRFADSRVGGHARLVRFLLARSHAEGLPDTASLKMGRYPRFEGAEQVTREVFGPALWTEPE